jgi:hypothetical protein
LPPPPITESAGTWTTACGAVRLAPSRIWRPAGSVDVAITSEMRTPCFPGHFILTRLAGRYHGRLGRDGRDVRKRAGSPLASLLAQRLRRLHRERTARGANRGEQADADHDRGNYRKEGKRVGEAGPTAQQGAANSSGE